MKLSAVLLSVNVIVLSQLPASAADTASFLQDTLSDAGTNAAPVALSAAPLQKKMPRTKISHAAAPVAAKPSATASHAPRYVAMTPQADSTIKLRAFVPGRYLPSAQAPVPQNQYVSMAPQYDTQGAICGQISQTVQRKTQQYQVAQMPRYQAPAEFTTPAYAQPQHSGGGDTVKKLAEAAVRKVSEFASRQKDSSRAIPGMNPVLPAQVQPAPQELAQSYTTPAQFMQPATMQQPMPMPNLGPVPASLGAPMLSPSEDRRLEALMEANMPSRVYGNQGVNGDMRSSVQGNPGLAGVGPPPFPLSLGGAQMGGRMGRLSGNPMVAQEARFGSWHGGPQPLQKSSFHSYISSSMAGPMSPAQAAASSTHNVSRRTSKQAHSVRAHVNHQASVQHVASSAPKPAAPKQAAVACYQPYRRYGS